MFLFSTPSYPKGDDILFRGWFSICHLVGMISALANPVLYGYYNSVGEQHKSYIAKLSPNPSFKLG